MPAMTTPKIRTLLGQPSWTLTDGDTSLAVTRKGGHLAPVTYWRSRGGWQPFAVAPWCREATARKLPPILEALRGDFFCLPFGGNDAPFRGEQHPIHGETANRDWRMVGIERDADIREIHLDMELHVRPGRVEKTLRLVKGHPAVYVRHRISGLAGRMNVGHHATLAFPDGPGSGLLAFSPFIRGQVYVRPVENPAQGGYSILQPGARFERLDQVPRTDGETADLSVYPAREGYEDIAIVCADPSLPFAWTAVTYPKAGYVWIALKDPRKLASTLLWMSNGGRHYPPWNGRHRAVMGLEEITSFFHEGIAPSVRPNELSKAGIPTCFAFHPDRPFTIPVIMAAAPVPHRFGRVKGVMPTPGGIRIEGSGRGKVEIPLDLEFVTRNDMTASM